ncbi:MerR family transcriptional regulator [Yoonia sp.]|uniref:MerR family transcriptional regulator n=1 Tax=Yoonia sp. TaxID=2212373 RepID=UPI0019E1686C|nr:MerR family transcriptional regulator [Yoonia sp.]MBE0412846.1 MerR family transcriptional regulator [Yoonia sp.]
MAKAKDAFRTISEVAEWLDTPTHVLRFWETKFAQIKPVKGAGGRRYYRPEDMDLLAGIKQLLHEDGLTIKGTQKLLREKGVKYVAALGPSITVAPDAESHAPASTAPVRTASHRPAAPRQDHLPFDPPAPAHVAAKPDKLFEKPADSNEIPPLPSRILGSVPVDPTALKANAHEIAQLLTRLEILRDRMRAV